MGKRRVTATKSSIATMVLLASIRLGYATVKRTVPMVRMNLHRDATMSHVDPINFNAKIDGLASRVLKYLKL